MPRLFAIVLIGVLSVGSTVVAHVTITLDPFEEARKQGLKVTDLHWVWVAIHGSNHVDVREIKRRTIRLGTRDTQGAKAKRRKRWDVNRDGFQDLLVRFKVEDTGLRDAEDKVAVLIGSFKEDTEVFTAYNTFDKGSAGDSSCYAVSGTTKVGIRCEFTESVTPLNLTDLVATINASLSDGTISDESAVVVELFGGEGHQGNKSGTCKRGDGGDRGYASSLFRLDDLKTIASNGQDLYAYVGEEGPNYQDGGSSTVLLGQPIGAISNVFNPPGEKVIGIAGGGGGGGGANHQAGACKRGYNGGDGGVANGSLLEDVSVAGGDGATKRKGQGGNQDGNGTGGSGGHEAGTGGIGGFGSRAEAQWAGSDVASLDWPHGRGGAGGGSIEHGAGGGGGGFGGGSGGGSGFHKGGGGGGGSWARQEAILSPEVGSQLVLGPAGDPGYPVALLTFEVLPTD